MAISFIMLVVFLSYKNVCKLMARPVSFTHVVLSSPFPSPLLLASQPPPPLFSTNTSSTTATSLLGGGSQVHAHRFDEKVNKKYTRCAWAGGTLSFPGFCNNRQFPVILSFMYFISKNSDSRFTWIHDFEENLTKSVGPMPFSAEH